MVLLAMACIALSAGPALADQGITLLNSTSNITASGSMDANQTAAQANVSQGNVMMLNISTNQEAQRWSTLGSNLTAQGNYTGAVEAYQKAVSVDPNSSITWFNLGNTQKAAGQPEEALKSYNRSLALDPKNKLTWFNQANTQAVNLSRYSEAIASYDQALAIDGNYSKAWFNRGVTQQTLLLDSDAVTSYDHVLALNKNDSVAWNNRGLALQNLSQYKEANESFVNASLTDPRLTATTQTTTRGSPLPVAVPILALVLAGWCIAARQR
jgi:tetratricopeptide (TPR) repeat protein